MKARPPRARITVRTEFCAALRLALAGRSDAENRALYGPCFSPHGHGHNYLLDVAVEGPVDPETGMVMDLNRLHALVRERLVEPVDHRNLNAEFELLAGRPPTTENLALAFWNALAPALPEGVTLAEIALRESRDHSVSYRGPGPGAP